MMPIEKGVSVERIRYLFHYDPITGEFWRAVHYRVNGFANTIITGKGVKVDDITLRTTRCIWAYYYKEWPPIDMFVDHKNRITATNNIDNLRLATPTQNQQNKAGYATYSKGVTWRDRIDKPWQAKIRVNGDRLHLGSFHTQEEAAEAYRQAAIKYHGEFACLV